MVLPVIFSHVGHIPLYWGKQQEQVYFLAYSSIIFSSSFLWALDHTWPLALLGLKKIVKT